MASLYVHIPFCEKKCIYCDFYSIENLSPMPAFMESLRREIQMSAHHNAKATSFDSLFFGGGTPSLLTPSSLKKIIAPLRESFRISDGAEVTLETNPGTVTPEKLEGFRAEGVNRLSIGIQSFHEEELKFLGRIHDGNQARECVEFARAAGFDNINIDLIFSLPGQTIDRWAETLSHGLDLAPDHISAYSLIVEDNTPLARMVASRQVSPNITEREAELYEYTMKVLEEEGYEHYEVSNYARPGFRSRHNYGYWSHDNYLGFGPSAHSFWRDENGTSARRWWNIANLSDYQAMISRGNLPIASEENLTSTQLWNESLFLGLRSDGIDLGRFERGGPTLQSRFISQLIQDRYAEVDGSRLRLTRKGYLLCDEICAKLIV